MSDVNGIPIAGVTEREGFEPSRELLAPYSLSRRVPSATRPPLRGERSPGRPRGTIVGWVGTATTRATPSSVPRTNVQRRTVPNRGLFPATRPLYRQSVPTAAEAPIASLLGWGLEGGLRERELRVRYRSAAADRQQGRGWSRAIGLDVEPGHFFEGADVAWRIAPFVLAGLLPFALVPVAGLSFADPRVAIAAAMVPMVVGSALLVPWERFQAWPQAIPPLAYFVILALLRDAGGDYPSVFDPLLAIPITWFAIYGTGRELALSIVAMGLTLLLPLALHWHVVNESEQIQRAIVAIVLAG